MLAFMIKACVTALRQFPVFNASLDKSGANVIIKNYYNIGVAVDTPGGLVVPDAGQELPIAKIANKWVLVVSEPDQPPLVATYTNNDPASITSTVQRTPNCSRSRSSSAVSSAERRRPGLPVSRRVPAAPSMVNVRLCILISVAAKFHKSSSGC